MCGRKYGRDVVNNKNFWKEYFSIPNLMGYFRIFLAFYYLAICFDAVSVQDYHHAGFVIAVSMITDFLDGRVARRFHMVTDWGKILDPVSDKITLGIVAFSLVLRYPLAEKVVMLFLIKEGFMAISGLLLMRRGWRTEGALLCGKICTASMYGISVVLLLFPELEPWEANALLLTELLIMLVTLISYLELYLCAGRMLQRGVDPGEISLWAISQEKKKKHRPAKRIVRTGIALYLVYLVVGAIIPYTKQPPVSQETITSFQAADCYADSAGVEESEGYVNSGGTGESERYVNSAGAGESEHRVREPAGSKTVDRVRIVDENKEALDLRLQMISHARERVVLSTFDFRSDEAGLDLLAALFNAAERGVKVEIFADGFNSWMRMEGNAWFYALSFHPNVTIRLYNKVNLLKPWTSMGRMHDKYVIVDDTAYVLGGRNAFGYFLGDYEGHKNYDWDVLVYHAQNTEEGSIRQLQEYYENITALDCVTLFHDNAPQFEKLSVGRARNALRKRYEELREAEPELFASEYDYLANTEPADRITLLSNPTGYQAKEPVVFYELMQLAQGAGKEVVIHTPYIMCNDWMYEELAKLGDKAVLMLNSAAGNGNPFACLDYLEHKEDLIDTGVRILEYEDGISYHGKVMTVDEDLAVVGSFNMDMRSTYLDTELMLVIDSREANRVLRDKMAQYESHAALVEDENSYRYIPEGMKMQSVSAARKGLHIVCGWLLERLRFLL